MRYGQISCSCLRCILCLALSRWISWILVKSMIRSQIDNMWPQIDYMFSKGDQSKKIITSHLNSDNLNTKD